MFVYCHQLEEVSDVWDLEGGVVHHVVSGVDVVLVLTLRVIVAGS